MTESKPIPAIARTALELVNAEYQRTIQLVAAQTIAAMGLDLADGWKVDFDNGVAIRETPDIQPKEAA